MFFGIIQVANAQDFVISQPFAAAQYLSPASVGNGVFDQRIQSNFRTESIGSSNFARSLVVGWDRKYNRRSLDQANYLGIGAQIISDQIMLGVMQNNYLSLNAAYHIHLDDEIKLKLKEKLELFGFKITVGLEYNSFAVKL